MASQLDSSVEAQALQVLNDLKAGKFTIGDILGPLYVSRGPAMNPTFNIPPGTKEQPVVAPSVAMLPAEDPFVAATVREVGPSPEVRPNPPPNPAGYDLVVVGGGVAGLLSVICAKALGQRACLVERHYMGGDCLNVGCFPSKAILACARAVHEVRNSPAFGVVLPPGEVGVDFGKVMARMRELRAAIAPHDGVDRYCRDFCEDVFMGEAKFTDKEGVLEVKRTHSAGTEDTEGGEGLVEVIEVKYRYAMVATGAAAWVPPVPGLRAAPHLTNASFFNLEERPPRVLLVGAGPIGLELAQAMARFGSEVTVLEAAPQLLPREDRAASEVLRGALERELTFHYGAAVTGIAYEPPFLGEEVPSSSESRTKAPWGTYKVSVTLQDGTACVAECEALLNATGRLPNVVGLGLENVGVEFDNRVGVHVDECFRTANPRIYSCGDCASPLKFTHAADWQARTAIRNMFLGLAESGSSLLVPWCTYTDPEVAHVGLYEEEMDARGIAYDTYQRELKDVDRCKCEGITEGFVKISARAGTDEILGATIVGPTAGDLISEVTLSMNNGIGLSKLAGCIHPYPTCAEAVNTNPLLSPSTSG